MQEHRGDGLPPSHRLGPYQIQRQLGRGGFAITYLAKDLLLRRQVAIKEFFPRNWVTRDRCWNVVAMEGHRAEFTGWLDKFKDEAQVLAGFRHPNIVPVFNYFTMHGTGYIVMEFIGEEKLSNRIEQRGTLKEVDIRQHVMPILDALEAVHDKGLLHRDIKPDNIILRPDGSPVLVDFGAARSTNRAAAGDATVIFTCSYASLEQQTGAPQHEASDIYSLGAVLYHCVTGNPPAGSSAATTVDLANARGYSPALIAMIEVAVAVQMSERPQSVKAWRDLLRNVQAFDPEILALGIQISGFHVEAGARKFADFAAAFAREMDTTFDRFKPYLRSFYEGVRHMPGTEDFRGDMSTPEEVTRWYEGEMAASDAERQYQRGLLAYEEDAEEAASWYTKAMEQGHARAAYALAMMHWNGEIDGWSIDVRVLEAVSHCEEAAQCGVEEAREFLARGLGSGLDAYRRGEHEEAEREFRRVAEQSGGCRWSSRADRSDAGFRLAQMYREREIVRWEEEVDAQEGALHWFRRSAELGYTRALYGMYATLSGIYDLVDHFDPVIHGGLEAPNWQQRATELDAEEQYMAGLHSEADCDHADEKEAEFWYRLAAEDGHLDSQFRLGMILYLNPNVDEGEGELWLVGAAADGHDAAASLAALFIAREEGEEHDPTDLLANYGFRYAPIVSFPDFAKEMLTKHREPAGAIRPLLRGLYATYRSAARFAGADQANELSSDAEIEEWYATSNEEL